MKNIHILPTDKPSRLGKFIDTNNLFLRTSNDIPRGENVHIYITSDEEIKKEDWGWYHKNKISQAFGKIILTTDQDLIKDGVQAIDDEFLEWFVKNPSCEKVDIKKIYLSNKGEWKDVLLPSEWEVDTKINYKIIIPKEEPKQETLEEAVERLIKLNRQDAFYEGAKWQSERMYSEEDLRNAYFSAIQSTGEGWNGEYAQGNSPNVKEIFAKDFTQWFEQFNKKQ